MQLLARWGNGSQAPDDATTHTHQLLGSAHA